MLEPNDIEKATNVFVEACSAVAREFAHDGVAGEEDFSGQLVGWLKAQFSGLKTESSRWSIGGAITEAQDGPAIPSIRFSARQTSKTTEEPNTGADMLMVLDIQSQDYSIQKGVLIQAKRLTRGKALPESIATKLRGQCEDMLDLSAASFVFLYAPGDFAVLSATAIEGSKRNDLHQLEQFPISEAIFFSDFINCWIGDPRLRATDKQSLAVLRSLSRARNALLIRAETEARS